MEKLETIWGQRDDGNYLGTEGCWKLPGDRGMLETIWGQRDAGNYLGTEGCWKLLWRLILHRRYAGNYPGG